MPDDDRQQHHDDDLTRDEAVADVAELNAQISASRVALERGARARLEPALLQLQHALAMLTERLAGRDNALTSGVLDTTPDLVRRLTQRWTRDAGPAPPLRLPGGNAAASALDLAAAIALRATCRVKRLPPSADARDLATGILGPLHTCLAAAARVALLPPERDGLASEPPDSPARSDSLRRAMRLARSLLEARGELTLEPGAGLCAGGRPLREDTALVDEVLRETGFGCTLFEGNVRVATTATARGSDTRAVGTTANDMVTAEVLEQGKTFHGITNTIGKDWLIRYEPLRTATGRIVGMVATYRELTDVLR